VPTRLVDFGHSPNRVAVLVTALLLGLIAFLILRFPAVLCPGRPRLWHGAATGAGKEAASRLIEAKNLRNPRS
jgi:hypothetical protein